MRKFSRTKSVTVILDKNVMECFLYNKQQFLLCRLEETFNIEMWNMKIKIYIKTIVLPIFSGMCMVVTQGYQLKNYDGMQN